MSNSRLLLLQDDKMKKSVNSDMEDKTCYKKNIIPFLNKYMPITEWLPKYRPSHLIADFIAGVTVGLMVVPQALAYASLAGLQNQYGLYSSFMGCFVYCFFGTSKDLTLGPTAILSLMVNIYGNPENPVYTVTFTFYIGVILFGMGLFRLGFLVKLISIPVISAFTSAAAIVIAMSQVKDILGLHEIPRDFIKSIITMGKKIKDVNPWDILFGICCMVLLILLKFLSKVSWVRDPPTEGMSVIKIVVSKILWFLATAKNAVVVFISIIIGYILVKKHDRNILTLSEDIDFGLPPFEVGNNCIKMLQW